MGVKLSELIPKKEIEFESLSKKKVAVDFSNSCYQFLSSIRQKDGALLTDRQGRVTSHLVGLFSRTANLMLKDIKLCYVFDGKPPSLKAKEKEKREQRKKLAEEKLKEAIEKDNVDEMLKYSKQTIRLTPGMVEESKKLINALGLPSIQAPSEADAQIAAMCNKDFDFGATSDLDPLLHGCPKIITNLTTSQRKKLPSGSYILIKPELVELKEVLEKLNINQDQLVVLGILVGSDYNPGGIRNIGPKKALKLIHEHSSFGDLFKELEADFDWEEIYKIFKTMPVIKDYSIEWKDVDREKIKEILVDEHDFSEERVNKTLDKLEKKEKDKKQAGLDRWVS